MAAEEGTGGVALAFPGGGGFCVEYHRISRPPLPIVEPGRSVLIEQAMQMLGVSRRTVYYWIRQGRLRTVRTRMGSQRVLLESIRDLEYVAGAGAAVRPARDCRAAWCVDVLVPAAGSSSWRKYVHSPWCKALVALGPRGLCRSSCSPPASRPPGTGTAPGCRPTSSSTCPPAPGRTVDVIVTGSRDEIAALAARHGVAPKRWLADGAVLRGQRRTRWRR